jgi:hypothetical protein
MENLKEGGLLGDLEVEWTGFIWFRIGFSDGLR